MYLSFHNYIYVTNNMNDNKEISYDLRFMIYLSYDFVNNRKSV